MKTIHLICNPVSGKGLTLTSLSKIKDWAKVQNDLDLKIHMTENVGHATIITKDLTSTGQPVTIFVLGGDGTVNEVLNGIDNFENTKIGILPFGSGNDFAFALDLKMNDPVELFNAYLNNSKERKVDFLLLNNKYRVMNAVGIGLSADVIACRNKMKHFKPHTQYSIATIRKSLFWRGKDLTIQLDDGAPQSIRTMWLTCNNGKRVGSNVITAPTSKVDDGLINLSYIDAFKHIKTLHYLIKIKKGQIEKVPVAKFATAKEINISLSDSPIEYDGNLLEHQNQVNIKVVPSKLNLIVDK